MYSSYDKGLKLIISISLENFVLENKKVSEIRLNHFVIYQTIYLGTCKTQLHHCAKKQSRAKSKVVVKNLFISFYKLFFYVILG